MIKRNEKINLSQLTEARKFRTFKTSRIPFRFFVMHNIKIKKSSSRSLQTIFGARSHNLWISVKDVNKIYGKYIKISQ